MNMQSPMPDIAEPVAAPATLVAERVDLHYGAAQALRGVSLTAAAGKGTALMGRNGVGKTSFLRAGFGGEAISRGENRFYRQAPRREPPPQRAPPRIRHLS